MDQIDTLHPKLRQLARDAYNEAVASTPVGVHPVITQGYRTFEESERLYALGRTIVNPDGKSDKKPMGNIVSNATPGKSWHNYGLAIDIALVIHGETVWDEKHPAWMTVVNAFKKRGFTWGGDFPGPFKDYPHLEMKFGHSIMEMLQKYNAGDFISGTHYVNI